MRFSIIGRSGCCVALAVSMSACAPAQRSADTTIAVDTLKPAVATLPDSTASVAAKADSAKAATPTKAPGTASKTTRVIQAKDTAHLGRDSVIRIDPRDPRRQLPTVPPRKPPQ